MPASSEADLYRRASQAVVLLEARNENYVWIGSGSGFFVSPDGLLVTNYHVVERAEYITAYLKSAGRAPVALPVEGIVAADPNSDLAVLKVRGTNFPHLSLSDGNAPEIGTKLCIISHPKGSLFSSLSPGMITGYYQQTNQLRLIQTDAPVVHGSSGGPVMTLDGNVIGVIAGKWETNFNIAVPGENVRPLLSGGRNRRVLSQPEGRWYDKDVVAELDKAVEAVNRRRDLQEADRILQGLRQTADNPYVWSASAWVQFLRGDANAALRCLEKAVEIRPEYAMAYVDMSRILHYQQLYEKGKAAARSALQHKPSFVAYIWLGENCMGLHQYEGALWAYQSALALRKDSPDAMLRVGDAYRLLGHDAGALDAYRRCLARVDPALQPFYAAQAHRWIGEICLSRKQYEEAAQECQAAVRICPSYADAYCRLGQAWLELRRTGDAVEAFRRARACDPCGPFGKAASRKLTELGVRD